jgi:hypothetical protein
MSQVPALDQSIEKKMLEKFEKNYQQIGFSARLVQNEPNKIRIIYAGRPPTKYPRSQGSHTFALSGTFRALTLMLRNVTMDEALNRICLFNDLFFLLYALSSPTTNELIRNIENIIEKIRSRSDISAEMKCPYLLEYLTNFAYLNHCFSQTTTNLVKKSSRENGREGKTIEKALSRLEEMEKQTPNLEEIKTCLSALVDSKTIIKKIEHRIKNNSDILPLIFHQIFYMHCLLAYLPKVRKTWLGLTDLVRLAQTNIIPNVYIMDIRQMIFYSSEEKMSVNTASTEENWIREAFTYLHEYSKLDAWHEQKKAMPLS